MAEKFLYGASVQGIQGFIFQTNKLKEIVGASELIEQICTTKFLDVAGILNDDKNLIINAAGNIKYIFEDKTKCEHLVRIFPKVIMDFAPGITISQAVVRIEDDLKDTDIDRLEKQLKKQRNKVSIPFETGYMMLNRARRTGGIVHKNNEDLATIEKHKAQENEKLFEKFSGIKTKNREIPLDISDINNGAENSWIAVIHADGNGLGSLIQNHGGKLLANKEFAKFSNGIQQATEKACQLTFDELIEKGTKGKYPVRPIIIGGDDLTIVIRADLALKFTEKYLEHFESTTKMAFNDLKTKEVKEGLTACAGITYVKNNYPLHYALELAEDLCKKAKSLVKKDVSKRPDGMPESSLAFFKVMDSFVEPLDEMIERSMKTDLGVNYFYGPYLLKPKEGKADLNTLRKKLSIIEGEANKNDKSKGVSKLRQLISESFKNEGNLEIIKSRMSVINKEFADKIGLKNDLKSNSASMLYDLINIHGFEYKKAYDDN